MIDDEAEYNARRQIRAQADADVAAFIASLDQDEESGVPPPVKIKISEVSTQPVEFAPFDFGHEESGTATAAGSTPAPATCPHSVAPCTIDLTVSTPHGYSVSQSGLLIASGSSGDVTNPSTPPGFYSDWYGSGICSGCNATADACKCGFSSQWIDAGGIPGTGQWVILDVNFIEGDSQLTPDGWWLSVAISDTTCYYGNCDLPISGFCTECYVYLGADDSIFSTDFSVHMDIQNNAPCVPGDGPASFDITFHPC